MKYKPEFAKGQIIVIFNQRMKVDYEEYAKGFANALGYEVLLEENESDIIFLTKPGSERKAIRILEKKPQVEAAYQRDLRYERRAHLQEKIADAADTLMDVLDHRESKYQGSLEELVQLCRKAKKL
jgi:hypothetical protein